MPRPIGADLGGLVVVVRHDRFDGAGGHRSPGDCSRVGGLAAFWHGDGRAREAFGRFSSRAGPGVTRVQ